MQAWAYFTTGDGVGTQWLGGVWEVLHTILAICARIASLPHLNVPSLYPDTTPWQATVSMYVKNGFCLSTSLKVLVAGLSSSQPNTWLAATASILDSCPLVTFVFGRN